MSVFFIIYLIYFIKTIWLIKKKWKKEIEILFWIRWTVNFSKNSNRVHKRGRICKSLRLVPTKFFDIPTALLCSLRIMGWIRLHRRKLWETIGSCFMAHVWGPQKAFQKNFHPICGFYKITSVNLYDLSSLS